MAPLTRFRAHESHVHSGEKRLLIVFEHGIDLESHYRPRNRILRATSKRARNTTDNRRDFRVSSSRSVNRTIVEQHRASA